MNEFYNCSFLIPSHFDYARCDALRMTHRNKLQKRFFTCSFLSPSTPLRINSRKERKEACTKKELLEFLSVTLKRINSLRSNTIRFLTLHSVKFFNAILLMCGYRRKQ